MFKTFEEGVYSLIVSDFRIREVLSRFGEFPAVFRDSAPNDLDSKWENGCFPRIVYTVDWRDEPDRKSSGLMYVDIYTTNENSRKPHDIADLLINNISGVFFNTEKGVFSCHWLDSEHFEIKDQEAQINVLELVFNIHSYPSQKTYLDPDPVPAVKVAIKDICSDFLVINLDRLPDIFRAESPVVYVRSIGTRNAGHDTYSYRWLNWTGAIHVMCTDYELMRKAIGIIQQSLALEGEITLLENGGQLRIEAANQNVTVTYPANQLIDGQFTLDTEFALYRRPNPNRLKKISIKGTIENYESRKDNSSRRD